MVSLSDGKYGEDRKTRSRKLYDKNVPVKKFDDIFCFIFNTRFNPCKFVIINVSEESSEL